MAKLKKVSTRLKKPSTKKQLFTDVALLIDTSRQYVATTANTTLTLLFWKTGERINREILGNKRADYGKQIVATLSQQLTASYGKGFNYSALTRMIKFAEVFPDEQIVATLSQQLSWSHMVTLIPLKQPLQREFYAEMSRIERWGVKTVREGQPDMPAF
jgi:hypothetical protein